jgi:hypothetical protein
MVASADASVSVWQPSLVIRACVAVEGEFPSHD